MANGLLDTFNNLGLSSKLGLLATGVDILEGRPLGEAVKTGLTAYGGLSNIEKDRRRKEAITQLQAKFPNNPLVTAYPEVFAKQYLEKQFTEKTPKEPKTYKDEYGRTRYLSNPPEGKNIGDLIIDSSNDTTRLNLTTDQIAIGNTVRDDIYRDLKNYNLAKDGFTRIKEFYNNPSQISDYALAVSFVKVLDPTSVAREGEVNAAQNSAAMTEAFGTAVKRLFSNQERLPASVRNEMFARSESLYKSQESEASSYLKRVKETLDKINPDLYQYAYFGQPIDQSVGTQSNNQNTPPFSFTSTILNRTFNSLEEAEAAFTAELEIIEGLTDQAEKSRRLLELNSEYNRLRGNR